MPELYKQKVILDQKLRMKTNLICMNFYTKMVCKDRGRKVSARFVERCTSGVVLNRLKLCELSHEDSHGFVLRSVILNIANKGLSVKPGKHLVKIHSRNKTFDEFRYC